MTFALHPQLKADTLEVVELSLCRVLLMNNSHFPWLILVPRREGLRELFDLPALEYDAVMREVREVSVRLQKFTRADKMNVAALGNVVPQLHIHVIARFARDAAWPQPVWNCGAPALPYDAATMKNLASQLRDLLQDMAL